MLIRKKNDDFTPGAIIVVEGKQSGAKENKIPVIFVALCD